MKSRKNKNSRIDLYKQAYLIKEGRGRGDLTKYDTTFPFEDDQFNYLSKYQNQYFYCTSKDGVEFGAPW